MDHEHNDQIEQLAMLNHAMLEVAGQLQAISAGMTAQSQMLGQLLGQVRDELRDIERNTRRRY